MNPTVKAYALRFLISVLDGAGIATGVFCTLWLLWQFI